MRRFKSVSGVQPPMKAEIVDEAIKWCLAEIHAKLKEAEQIARAAQACAQAGGIAEAIQGLHGY